MFPSASNDFLLGEFKLGHERLLIPEGVHTPARGVHTAGAPSPQSDSVDSPHEHLASSSSAAESRRRIGATLANEIPPSLKSAPSTLRLSPSPSSSSSSPPFSDVSYGMAPSSGKPASLSRWLVWLASTTNSFPRSLLPSSDSSVPSASSSSSSSSPFRWGGRFSSLNSSTLLLVDVVMDGIFLILLLLQFQISYVDKRTKTEISNRNSIKRHLLLHSPLFYTDVATCFVSLLFLMLVKRGDEGRYSSFILLKLLRVWRLWQLPVWMDGLQVLPQFQLGRLLITMWMILHALACSYFVVVRDEGTFALHIAHATGQAEAGH
eukprot:GHVT01090443.1.p1 GENE.GHVT01090443.1~~GHVT01090443.1.p1  ORF type:complete len:321 (-),score=74.43 GHVT01090443.1:1227-2189(-)